MANRNPKSGPIVDARRAIATIDESSSEAELRLTEELIAEGLEYAEGQLKGLPSRARYLRDAVTEVTAMHETWRSIAPRENAGFCRRGDIGVVELAAYRTGRGSRA
jgi:hypothetical protein